MLSRFTTGGADAGLGAGVGFFIGEGLDTTDGLGAGVAFAADKTGFLTLAVEFTGRMVDGFAVGITFFDDEAPVEVEVEDEDEAGVLGFLSLGISAICRNSFGMAFLFPLNDAYFISSS